MSTGSESREEIAAHAEQLLANARAESRTGSHERAWRTSREAAALGRTLGDAQVVARAATALSGPDILSRRLTSERQALCLEALAMLGDSDAELRDHVVAHLTAIATPWSTPPASGASGITTDEVERRFAQLRAEHARALGPAGTGDRLATAGALVELGLAAADDEILGWGRLWRLDALIQLGLRFEYNVELSRFVEVVARLDSPVWDWRLTCVQAGLALLEDRVADVPSLLESVIRLGEKSGLEDAPWLALTLQSALATRTGEGLEDVESLIRRALVGAPAFAHGWRVTVLHAMGRHEEASTIWRILAPHLEEFPPHAVEWVLAMTAFADAAIIAGDADRGRWLLDALSPYAHLHAIATATGPYYGPVALALGRLALFLDEPALAERWLSDAARRADEVAAPWHAARARDALAILDPADGPLTPPESEIARLVAEGNSNRQIASRLYLSERTVEQHVSSALRKLGMPNRAALATWVTQRAGVMRRATLLASMGVRDSTDAGVRDRP